MAFGIIDEANDCSMEVENYFQQLLVSNGGFGIVLGNDLFGCRGDVSARPAIILMANLWYSVADKH